MPNREPTRRELEVLRFLAVGMALEPAAPSSGRYPVVAKGAVVMSIQQGTVFAMQDAGWIDTQRQLTPLGRDVAEVKVFVRSFSGSVRP